MYFRIRNTLKKKNQNHTPKHLGNMQIMIFLVWYCILNGGWVSFKTFLFKIILFYVFGLFRCANIKNNFKKLKIYIILIHFQVKKTLKNNNH